MIDNYAIDMSTVTLEELRRLITLLRKHGYKQRQNHPNFLEPTNRLVINNEKKNWGLYKGLVFQGMTTKAVIGEPDDIMLSIQAKMLGM